MSALIDNLAEAAGGAVVDACWRQWRDLQNTGRPVSDAQPLQSIIDPDGLVLASLALRHKERRLQDALQWWIETGVRLNSVQRTRTVLRAFPERVSREFGWYSRLAAQAGDPRWAKWATSHDEGEVPRPGKVFERLQLIEPSTLMVRLRAGFGVGAKADLLTFLIGAHRSLDSKDIWVPANLIAEFTSYSKTSVRRAIAEMVLARLVEESADSAPMYGIDLVAWTNFLSQDALPGRARELPAWRFWSHVYAFLVAAHDWSMDQSIRTAAPVAQASAARDIHDRFGKVLVWMRLSPPDDHGHPGHRFLEVFEHTVRQACAWTRSRL
jgi:hypothetical protein